MMNTINYGNNNGEKVLNTGVHTTNNDAKVLNNDELVDAIMRECKRSAATARAKYGQGKMADLEGTLIAQIWETIMKKPSSFHTVIFIRRLIKQRTVNHIKRDLMPHNKTIVFSMLKGAEKEPTGDTLNSDAYEWETNLHDNDTRINQMELGNELKTFLGTLTDKQRQILELHTAGYGNNEICDIVGCSVNTPKNTLKTVKGLAMSFGL
ncbi:LuxR C-terminal-related transcriptional regulator [Paenibacillus sp. OV219]|uniref:LuxR C-terminal-related transcriptional regulator n=1 Tax=Paenibacillus sp. OV219 TaxID=1884377 RepID=UPI0008C08598|nr:LuxR C-terminal-related transcriptional regulator [Paenibacillus sp. OV219]SEN20194.1 regulatory protein, luxR family [Paenibacillus sp. OV219]